MKMRYFMEGPNVSEISKEAIEKFHQSWMVSENVDHAPERKRKNYLADKICKELKYISGLIKVQPENVELQLLLELDALNEKCKNTITDSTRNVGATSTSGASRSDLSRFVLLFILFCESG
ncbi:hypothetical protein Hanom_Chr12g01131791 [Helianthus anomalus]